MFYNQVNIDLERDIVFVTSKHCATGVYLIFKTKFVAKHTVKCLGTYFLDFAVSIKMNNMIGYLCDILFIKCVHVLNIRVIDQSKGTLRFQARLK